MNVEDRFDLVTQTFAKYLRAGIRSSTLTRRQVARTLGMTESRLARLMNDVSWESTVELVTAAMKLYRRLEAESGMPEGSTDR